MVRLRAVTVAQRSAAAERCTTQCSRLTVSEVTPDAWFRPSTTPAAAIGSGTPVSPVGERSSIVRGAAGDGEGALPACVRVRVLGAIYARPALLFPRSATHEGRQGPPSATTPR
jgi:hypothetical protein